LIEKDLFTIEATKQGASGIDIIGGAHQSDLDKSMHLTVVYDKGIKGKQHIPAHEIPTVFGGCRCVFGLGLGNDRHTDTSVF
jgi:hypothetical protein